MSRERDEPIPPEEPLFRAIAFDHVVAGAVLKAAIDPDGTSVDRSKYRSAPESKAAHAARHPSLTGVAETAGLRLPSPTEGDFGCFLHDDPNPPRDSPNDAHAEIRTRKLAHTSPKNKKPTDPLELDKLRAAIAKTMTIVIAPTATPTPPSV